MQDDAKCQQLGKGRFFIYVTHQRNGVTLFASRELSPIGVAKRRLLSEDGSGSAAVLIDEILRLAKAAGYGGRGLRPTADVLAQFVPAAAAKCGVEANFLRRTGAYSARVLVTLPAAV